MLITHFYLICRKVNSLKGLRVYEVQGLSVWNDFSPRFEPMLKITRSSTRRFTPRILLSCQGGASGSSTIGEWTLKPVTQLSVTEITESPPTVAALLGTQQGLLLGHQRAPAVRDDRHGLWDDSKLPLPCQQVSLKIPFIFYSPAACRLVQPAHFE